MAELLLRGVEQSTEQQASHGADSTDIHIMLLHDNDGQPFDEIAEALNTAGPPQLSPAVLPTTKDPTPTTGPTSDSEEFIPVTRSWTVNEVQAAYLRAKQSLEEAEAAVRKAERDFEQKAPVVQMEAKGTKRRATPTRQGPIKRGRGTIASPVLIEDESAESTDDPGSESADESEDDAVQPVGGRRRRLLVHPVLDEEDEDVMVAVMHELRRSNWVTIASRIREVTGKIYTPQDCHYHSLKSKTIDQKYLDYFSNL